MNARSGGLDVEVGLTLNRLTKELAAAEARMIKTAKRGEDAFEKANAKAGASFNRITRGAAKELATVDSIASRAAGSVGKFFANFAIGAAAGALSVAALGTAISNTLDELGALSDLSSRTGFSTDAIQGLQRGFQDTGVDVATLGKGLEQFSRRVGEAANGGPFLKTLKSYGVALRDSNGQVRDTMDILKDYASVLAALPEAQRLAGAQKGFGRVGIELAAGLAEGGKGLQNMIDKAREGGFIIDEALVQKADEIGDKWDALSLRIKVAFQSVAVDVAGALDALLDPQIDKINAIRAAAGAPNAEQFVPTALQDAAAQDEDVLQAAADAAATTAANYELITSAAETTAAGLLEVAASLRLVGEDTSAATIQNLADEMQGAVAEFKAGDLAADDFTAALTDVSSRAQDTIRNVGEIDGISFNATIANLGGLIGAINSVAGAAAGAVAAVLKLAGLSVTPPNAPSDASTSARHAEDRASRVIEGQRAEFAAAEAKQNALTSEQLSLNREIAQVQADAAEFNGTTLLPQEAERLAIARQTADATRAAAKEAAKGTSGGGRAKGGSGGNSEAAKAVKAADDMAEAMARQVEALELQIELVGKNTYEVVKAKTAQDLLNQAKQKGIDLDMQAGESGLTYRQAIEAQAETMGRLTQQYEFAQERADLYKDIQGQIVDGLIDAAVNGGDFAAVLSQIALQLSKLLLQGALSGSGPFGNLFGNPGGGLLSGLGFAEGGYTGDGGKYTPAGVVHKGEYVFDAASTRRIGAATLERMRRSLPGYASGGMVGAAPGGGQTNFRGGDVILIDDPERIGSYLNTRSGERKVVEIMRRNGVISGG